MTWNLAAEGVAANEAAEEALLADIAAVLRKPEYGTTGSSVHGEVISADPVHAPEDAAHAGAEPVPAPDVSPVG